MNDLRSWIAATALSTLALTALTALALTAGCGGPDAGLTRGPIEFEGPPGSGEPHLYATTDGRAILTWFEPAGDGHALKVAVRDAGGWSAPRTVVAGRDFFVNWADFPSLIELPDGTWIVHWLESVADDPYAYHVKMAISRDRGATWGEPFTPHRDDSPTEHGFVSIVPWRDGAALVWLDGREMAGAGAAEATSAPVVAGRTVSTGPDPATAPAPAPAPAPDGRPGRGQELELGVITLRATTLSADGDLGDETLLDGRTCECCQTALVRAGGDLVAAYRDRSQGEIRDISVVRYSEGDWTAPAHVADDGWHYPGCPVNGPQAAAHGDTIALAWFTAPENEPAVHAAFSTDRGATWGEKIRVDRGDPVGRVDVELLPDGRALVVWLERTEEAAEVTARIVRSDGTLSGPVRVAGTSEARSSGFPRTARIGGEVLVAWTLAGESGGVRVASVRLE